MQHVTFMLAGETLALPTAILREILEPVPVTRVPQADAFVAGLINVRGAVLPLVDLRVALGLPREGFGPEARILVLDLPLNAEIITLGLWAEAVLDVAPLSQTALLEVPQLGSRWPPDLIRAVARSARGFVTLPDLDQIFTRFLSSTAREA